MECLYFEVDNSKEDKKGNRIGNEVDLDRYLVENRDSLISMLNGAIDLTLSMQSNLKDGATQKDVIEFIDEMDTEALNVSKKVKVNVTTLWDRYNPDTDKVDPNENPYLEKKIAEYIKNNSGASRDDAIAHINIEELNNPSYINIGNAVGFALQNYNNEKRESLLKSKFNGTGKYGKLFGMKESDDRFYASVHKTVDSIVKMIHEKWGEDCKILFEKSVNTNDISNGMLNTLKAISSFEEKDSITSLLGRTDITVITKTGEVHTIEMKTKGIGSWKDAHPDDLKTYKYQVATYDLMRRQRKINTTPWLLLVTRNNDGSVVFNGKSNALLQVGTNEHEYRMAQSHIPVHKEVELKNTDESNKIMSAVFQTSGGIAKNVEMLKRDVDTWMSPENNTIKHVTEEMKDLWEKRHRFYYEEYREGRKSIKSAETREGLRDSLTDYIKYLNERSSNALLNFTKDFRYVKNTDELRLLLERLGYSRQAVDTMSNHLQKYIDGWTLDDNLALISNGFLLFRKGGRCEIVMFNEVKSLKEYHKFDNIKKGTTILGALYGDDEAGSGNRQILSSQYGNLMLMKAMAIISEDPLLFKDEKICSISAINPRYGEVLNTISNAKLNENWRMLAHKFKRLNLKLIDGCFMNDADAAVERARDWVKLLEGQKISNVSGAAVTVNTNFAKLGFNSEASKIAKEQIQSMINALESKYALGGSYSDSMDYRAKRAFAELNMALLAIDGYTISTENDVSAYFDQGVGITGSLMTPFYRSNSANLREFSRITNAFHYNMTQELQKVTSVFQDKLSKALKEHAKYSPSVGGEYTMSADWFVRDKDGNLDKRFIVKPPTDPYFVNRQAEKELLEFVLETFATWRWGEGNYSEYKSDYNSAYYQMPIYEAGYVETFDSSDNKIKSTISLGKKKVKRLINVGKELVNGREVDIRNYDDPEVLNQKETVNPFVDENRKEMLDTYGPDVFTKNIDDIFLFTATTAIKNQVSKKMLPILTAYRQLIHFMNNENDSDMKEIEDAIIRYMGTVIFDKSGAKDNYALQRVIQVFREMFSVMTLALSAKALVRDTFSSSLRTAVSILNGSDKSMGITSNEYFSAFADVCKNGDALFTSYGFLNQLNLAHRMANMSYREIAGQLKLNKFALKNVDQSFLFMTSTSSDFVHRMALLVAYLKKIGAYDAYTMKNGILAYDMKKDARFKILYKYDFGALTVNDDDKETFYKALRLYESSLKKWQASNTSLKFGDALPLALDPDQEQSIKSLSNNLYGAYDKEEQALVHSTLIGGAFLQFKTYGISRLIDWWRRPGQINIFESKTMVNEDGEELWIIQTSEEEFNETGVRTKLVPFNQVPVEQLVNGISKPFKMEMSAIDEGRLQSAYGLCAALYLATYGDDLKKKREAEELLREKLKDPMTRENIVRAFLDILMGLIIQGALMIIYPEEVRTNLSKQDWWTRWSYAVASGIAQDGPVWEVVKSVWGGGEIPMVSGLARFANSAMGVIHGNEFLPALANSFGATRELSAMLKDL